MTNIHQLFDVADKHLVTLKSELHKVINHEKYDDVTVTYILGILELMKHEFMMALK